MKTMNQMKLKMLIDIFLPFDKLSSFSSFEVFGRLLMIKSFTIKKKNLTTTKRLRKFKLFQTCVYKGHPRRSCLWQSFNTYKCFSLFSTKTPISHSTNKDINIMLTFCFCLCIGNGGERNRSTN